MDARSMFPSKYLKADDVVTPIVVLMDRVVYEEIGREGERETKPVLYFQNIKRGLVLNKTNADVITTLHGWDTNEWKGKKIGLFRGQTQLPGGKQGWGTRVSLTVPKKEPTGMVEPEETAPAAQDDELDEEDPFKDD